MKSLLQNLMKGAALGLGFGLAFLFLVFVFAKTVGKTEFAAESIHLNESEKMAVLLSEESVAVKDGRIIVNAIIDNQFSEPLSLVWLTALIYENDQLIERCSGSTSGTVAPNDSQLVVILCEHYWKSIDEDGLRVALRIKVAQKGDRE